MGFNRSVLINVHGIAHQCTPPPPPRYGEGGGWKDRRGSWLVTKANSRASDPPSTSINNKTFNSTYEWINKSITKSINR